MNRRGFLGAMLLLGAAPAIVKASSLMKMSPTGIILPSHPMVGDTITFEGVDGEFIVYRGMVVTGMRVTFEGDRAAYEVDFQQSLDCARAVRYGEDDLRIVKQPVVGSISGEGPCPFEEGKSYTIEEKRSAIEDSEEEAVEQQVFQQTAIEDERNIFSEGSAPFASILIPKARLESIRSARAGIEARVLRSDHLHQLALPEQGGHDQPLQAQRRRSSILR